MSSKPIYPHVPYFYIIEHISTGKRYVGSRWAKGCNPAEFMQPGGYQTSSTTIKKIIKKEGIDAFRTIHIQTQEEIGDVYDYETKFLLENDCAKSDIWFNMHNNTKITTGTEEYRNAMLAKYGVDHNSHLPDFAESARRTCMKNYGVENPMHSEEIKNKLKNTCVTLYGVENPMQSPEIQEKARQTMYERYGVDNYSQTNEYREKFRNTSIKNHGTCHPSQSVIIQEKAKQTWVENYGVEHPMHSEEIKERLKQTNLTKRGVLYPMQSLEVQDLARKSRHKNTELKITNEILQGDFSRFEYLWDTVDEVFLMGIFRVLNRNCKDRYIRITSNRQFKIYTDSLTGKLYYINPSRFSMPLPENLVPYSTRKKR